RRQVGEVACSAPSRTPPDPRYQYATPSRNTPASKYPPTRHPIDSDEVSAIALTAAKTASANPSCRNIGIPRRRLTPSDLRHDQLVLTVVELAAQPHRPSSDRQGHVAPAQSEPAAYAPIAVEPRPPRRVARHILAPHRHGAIHTPQDR